MCRGVVVSEGEIQLKVQSKLLWKAKMNIIINRRQDDNARLPSMGYSFLQMQTPRERFTKHTHTVPLNGIVCGCVCVWVLAM